MTTDEPAAILMPVGPEAPFLTEALESLTRQIDDRWRLIAILDRTPISAVAALESFAPGRTTLVVSQRPGIAAALNAGLAEVQSDIVIRFDADDVMESERVGLQIDYLAQHPEIAVVHSPATIIDEAGSQIGIRTMPATDRATRHRLLRRNAVIHPTVAVRRSALVNAGGYDEAAVRVEDYALWLRLAALGHGFAGLEEPLLRYRVHGTQHSTRSVIGRSERRVIAHRRAELGRAMGVPQWRVTGHQVAWVTWNLGRATTRRLRP